MNFIIVNIVIHFLEHIQLLSLLQCLLRAVPRYVLENSESNHWNLENSGPTRHHCTGGTEARVRWPLLKAVQSVDS